MKEGTRMELQIKVTENGVELDNGSQYIQLDMKQAKKVIEVIRKKLHSDKTEANLKKNWNFLGGL